MSLDLHKVAFQVESVASELSDAQTNWSAKLKDTVHNLTTAEPSSIEEKRIRSRSTFLTAGVGTSISEKHNPTQLPKDYTVLAVDGSHIDVDRHLALKCYLINIGKVSITYGENPYASLSNDPRLYSEEGDMHILQSQGNRAQVLEGNLLGALRAVEEINALSFLANETDPKVPKLALIDGSLILWTLIGQGYADFVRQRLIEEVFLPALEKLHKMALTQSLVVASYVSLPRSSDLINALRLDERYCHYETANCDINCGQLKPGLRPCDILSGISDRDILGLLLNPGQRSDTFASTSSIVRDYYGENQIHFFYLNNGSEISRVEIPSWVANNKQMLDLTHSLILNQCDKGHGYPLALSEAHEQAVITTSDREQFRALISNALNRHNLASDTSQKNLSKKLKWL